MTTEELKRRLPRQAQAWLAAVSGQPLAEVFPAVVRAVGRAPLPPPAAGHEGPASGESWTTDQAVRTLLLVGVAAGDLAEVYRFGDSAEKLAVLKALPLLEGVGDGALPLTHDAIRTNDQRLLAAALGPYATRWLPQAEFRQAVLKCVFAGLPLAAVDGLPDRADAELSRMMKDFAAERTAAGRVIPADLVPYLSPAVSPS
jgi:hypothetical protein